MCLARLFLTSTLALTISSQGRVPGGNRRTLSTLVCPRNRSRFELRVITPSACDLTSHTAPSGIVAISSKLPSMPPELRRSYSRFNCPSTRSFRCTRQWAKGCRDVLSILTSHNILAHMGPPLVYCTPSPRKPLRRRPEPRSADSSFYGQRSVTCDMLSSLLHSWRRGAYGRRWFERVTVSGLGRAAENIRENDEAPGLTKSHGRHHLESNEIGGVDRLI